MTTLIPHHENVEGRQGLRIEEGKSAAPKPDDQRPLSGHWVLRTNECSITGEAWYLQRSLGKNGIFRTVTDSMQEEVRQLYF